ncbi:MAG: heavy-metal-associated domain-containing protein, partial [Verrucomicrobiia bacterium]
CSHCRASATDGLKNLPFTQHVDIDLKSGQAHISGTALDREAISHKLHSLGFTLRDFTLQTKEASQ